MNAPLPTNEIERLLEACVSRVSDLIVITEADPLEEPGPRILYVNEAFVQLTGYSRSETIGRSPRFLQGPQTSRAALGRIRGALQRQEPVREELLNYAKSGREYWVEIDMVPIRDPAGRASHIVAIQRDITERKRSEQTLRASEERFRMLFANNPQPMWAYDVKTTRFLAVNDAAVRRYGYSAEEFLAMTVRDLRPPDDSPELEQALADATKDGRTSVRYRHRKKDRAIIDVEISSESVVLDGREARLVLATDVTERIRAERETLRANQALRRTHEAVITLARGISTAIGSEFFHRLTHSLTEAVDAHSGFVAKLDPREAGVVRSLCAVQMGREVPNFSCQLSDLPLTNGLWVVEREAWRLLPHAQLVVEGRIEAFVGTPLADAGGQTVGAMFVLFDHPLKQADFIISILKIFAARAAGEIQRQASEATTREQAALLDKAQDAILVRDLEHRITYWNHSAEKLYGWTKTEAIGRSVRGWLNPDPAEFDRAMESLLAQGDWVGEIAQVAKDGRPLTIEGHWTLVRDENGASRVLAINTDISERKKLQQQFFRAQRLESIGTLAGGIAHDLNNLLAPMMMGVDLLRKDGALSSRSATVLDSIKRSADRGANLVKQVLSFARGMDGEKVGLDLRQIVREVESLIENSFPKNIVVESRFSPDLSPVVGDPTQLNQVLVNLCVNARDAMPHGGRILLTVHDAEVDEQYAAMNRGTIAGRFAVIEVADTGSGMSKAVMDRIFEPFYTTKEFGKGTGLGLATARGIVRGHGGFISVYSELGKGSTFKVYLPAQVGGVASRPHGEGEAELPRGRGELVLLVDDELSIREVTQRTLESFGYRVIAAEDGADAMVRYAEHRREIAVVLTDMMMPVMDGVALSVALKRIDPEIPIIATSGLSANGSLTQAPNLGMTGFLAKPYSAGALLKEINSALQPKSPQPIRLPP